MGEEQLSSYNITKLVLITFAISPFVPKP